MSCLMPFDLRRWLVGFYDLLSILAVWCLGAAEGFLGR